MDSPVKVVLAGTEIFLRKEIKYPRDQGHTVELIGIRPT